MPTSGRRSASSRGAIEAARIASVVQGRAPPTSLRRIGVAQRSSPTEPSRSSESATGRAVALEVRRAERLSQMGQRGRDQLDDVPIGVDDRMIELHHAPIRQYLVVPLYRCTPGPEARFGACSSRWGSKSSSPTRHPSASTSCCTTASSRPCFAEQMGFDRIWAPEHHSLKWYAHMSAPEIFLTWVAAARPRIRVGHGVVLMPFNYNHPVRVAERAAMLDALSGGRLDLGAGRGATLQEMTLCGVDPERTYLEVEESLR